jgi:glycosyltransferase involved in cell wall biosynthesis
MTSKLPLTVLFTTYNEAHNIGAALESVKNWADEIMVVDSYSTDDTKKIVHTYENIRFLEHHYYSPAFQKNWAIPMAENEWVLIMDADERATAELRAEIEAILRDPALNTQEGFDCFWIGFTHYFMGKKVQYSGWQNDKTIRLIRRDICRYNTQMVHEEIITEGVRVGYIKNKFQHYTFKDINHFIAKQQRYAFWSAEDKATTTGNINYFHLFLKPLFRFFKHFIIKKGFLDGKIGFMISAIAAWSVFLRYAKMMENRQSKNIQK